VHRSRLLAGLGALSAAGALLLPYASFPGLGSRSGIEAEAWPVVLLLGPVLILSVIGDRGEAPARPIAWIGVGLTCSGFAFAIAKLVDAWMAAGDAAGAVGVGAWLGAAAAGLALVGMLLGFSRRI